MRVMAYNILEGAYISEGERTHRVLNLIERADPDVVGLCECTDFDENRGERLNRFRKRLNMDAIMNRAGSGHHVAVLWRKDLPVVSRTALANTMYNGFARIIVKTQELGRVAIVMTHLHPFSSWQRVGEAQQVIARARSGEQAIIMGDMNNLAPTDLDRLPSDHSEITSNLRSRMSGPDYKIDTLPIETFLNHDFLDLGASSVGPTYPTTIGGKREEYGIAVRIDFIFATPRLAERCRSIQAIDEQAAHQASDHLPIVAEFDLTLDQ